MPGGGFVMTFTDITPSVEAAEALERANESLERRVRERTQELTRLNAALARAKADAEEANVSKTRFVAAASHDILQPLNAARLYVTSLVERQDAGEDSRLVENLDASLEAVEEILSALLDMSRLDTGVLKPEIASFRIDEILRQLEVEFAPLARSKGLEVVFVPCSLAVRSDRRLLRRLLQNLISNAIKYTPQGCVLVGCRRDAKRLRIDVYDTERIARMLDHKVDLKSTPGRGSHFSVEVPIAPALPSDGRAREPQRADAGQLAHMVVLCVDNDPQILDGMDTLLGGWGCTVLKAADLKSAETVIADAKTAPHGLLVDYHLDDGNGIDAIGELRRCFGADLPAILITADRSRHVREDARAQNIQVLHKPIKPAALRALIAQWRVQRVAAAE
jgi:CheY-like chemotaxis protein